ncbi:hypothetical protein PMAYCL1PPCAC_07433, partial [Pristionchus mayeri]
MNIHALRMTLQKAGATNVSEQRMKEVENMVHEQFLRLEKQSEDNDKDSALLLEIIEGDLEYRKKGYKPLGEKEQQRATRLVLS